MDVISFPVEASVIKDPIEKSLEDRIVRLSKVNPNEGVYLSQAIEEYKKYMKERPIRTEHLFMTTKLSKWQSVGLTPSLLLMRLTYAILGIVMCLFGAYLCA